MSELGFWNLAAEHPDKTALVAPDGQSVSAGELAAASNRLCRSLAAAGLEPGDVVATVLPNGREMIEMYLACFQGGWYLVPINHHLVAPEVAYIVKDSGAKIFVGHERFGSICTAAASEAGLPVGQCFAVGDVQGFSDYAVLQDGVSDAPPDNRSAGQVMNYTSGTTGQPKGVRRALIPGADPDVIGSMYALFLAMFGIQPLDDNVHLTGSPLYHTAVLMFTASSLHMGHTVVVMDKWTPEETLRLIQDEKVTTSHMVPTQFHRLLALSAEVRANYDLSSLRHMVHAAAPCPVETKRAMLDWWGPVIYEYYAASEGGGTLVTPEEWLQYPGTVGRAWANSEVRILTEQGEDCPVDTPGTVYMSLASANFEYHNDKKKTEENRRDGFFTVGDIGYLNAQGYLFLCDRKTDMIISGGVNIYPAEIEAELLGHPGVADAAVFGIPHPDWGEEVKAVVEAADGFAGGEELTASIMAHCEQRLAKYKRPRSIDFIEDMPRDPNGKLYKRKLRDPYWEGHDRAI